MTTMKTANKILFITFGILVIAIFAIMLTIRIQLSKEVMEGSGMIISEPRESRSFDGIVVQGSIDVYLKQGDAHSIIVYADDNLLEHIKTDINQDVLQISIGKRIKTIKKPKVYIEYVNMEKLNASAGAKLHAETAIHGNELSLNLRSGAEGHLNIIYQKADIEIKTGASATISGTVDTLIADSATGSKLDAKNLKSVNCYVSSKGGSSITVFVSGQLTAQASSGGIVRFTGDPIQTAHSTSSGGVIVSYSETFREE